MLLGVDLVVTVASGGAEDGSYTFGTASDVSCALRSFSTPNQAVTVDTTTRCATLTTTRGTRATRTVDMVIDVPDSGALVFGSSVNTVWQIIVKWVSTGSAETLNCALRSNTPSSDADGRQTQTVRFDVIALP